MATVGYGDVTASTNMEYAFITVIAVAGTLVSALVMGFISSQIAFESASDINADISLLTMRKKLLASPLDADNKRKFLENVDSMMEYTIPDQLQLLKTFPQFFYESLVKSLFLPHLEKSLIFKPLCSQAKEVASLDCKTYLCTAGQIIVSQGSPEDTLYIVMRGEVRIFGSLADGAQDVTYAVLNSDEAAETAYFGEQVMTVA
jgi:hypothetical protein